MQFSTITTSLVALLAGSVLADNCVQVIIPSHPFILINIYLKHPRDSNTAVPRFSRRVRLHICTSHLHTDSTDT